MTILIVLALLGVFGGYFVGKFVNPIEQEPPASEQEGAAPPAEPQTPPTADPPTDRTFYQHDDHGEPLPRDIVIQQNGDIRRVELPELDTEIDLSALVGKEPLGTDTERNEQTTERRPETATSPAQAPQTWRFTRAMPDDIANRQTGDAAALPAWQRFAYPITMDGRPKVVIVLDDVGVDRRRTRQAITLPGPLTLSYLAYANELEQQFAVAREAGHELLLHVPMEPRSASIDPGPNVLLSGMPEDELKKNIAWNLDQTSGFVGINNHMGSRFTSDRDGMDTVVESLRDRGLLFLDSVTSNRSVAHRAARDGGIPYAVRNVFLDHENDPKSIRRQLNQLERLAHRSGVAIAIGHPRDNTLSVLAEWLPKLEEKGLQLVPISAVVQVARAE